MSARIEPCGESIILTATLSLSYALRILFLYRVLYVFNLLGTKFLGNCMCYHGRVIVEGCRTKCVIDKYTNIFIF